MADAAPREEIELSHVPEQGRYELRLGERLAVVAEYRRQGDLVTFTHTWTEPQLRGRGLAAQLVEFALAETKAAGLGALPLCWFVGDYIAGHPEYVELVPAAERPRFGLRESA